MQGILSLPNEVLVQIFSYLRENDLINISKVCRRFNQIGGLDSLWKNLFHRVYEMDEAYIVPEQTMSLSPDRGMNSPQSLGNYFTYKEQFSVMVSTYIHNCANVLTACGQIKAKDAYCSCVAKK